MSELLASQRTKSAGTLALVRLLICIAVWIWLLPGVGLAEATRLTTPAGRVFHYVQMPEADRTAIVIDWKSTWAHDAEHPTTARMGAILMTIGGAGGKLEELIGELNAAGAHAELNATPDGARGLLVAQAGRLEEAAALVREALTNPRLDAASFESIRAELSRAVRATEPSAEALVSDAARRLLIGDAPLDDFLRLRVDDIEGATLWEVHAWRDAVFAQANATVAAAGVAPAADVAAAVDTLLERLPEFPAGEPADPLQPAYGGRTVLIVAPDADSSAIGVFGPLPSTGKFGGVLNVLALEALNRRLTWGLRREFGDAYDISARPANYARDVRLVAIGGEVAAPDAEEVLEVTRKIYEWFRGRGPTPRELAKGARHAARMFEGVQETPEAMAQIVAELVLDGELVTVADDLPARLRGVAPRTLQAHVKNAFPAWDEMLRIVVAPNAEAAPADCVIDALESLQTCP
jgi:zinc protease